MIANMINFVHENTYMVIALIVLALLFFYRRPKVFLTIFLFILIITVTFTLIFNISDTAVALKKDLIRQPADSLF
ncbi:MAG: hypothetical protein RDU01_01675 [Thermodesulfovibrionales bacterium]|nr:hypothetical protein [Thermodesulfovibrionales bacterium]